MLRTIISVASTYFTTLPTTKNTFSRPSTLKLFHVILTSFDDRRPKVRKHAHSSASSVLLHHSPNYQLADHVGEFVQTVLKSTTATDTTKALHLLSFLQQVSLTQFSLRLPRRLPHHSYKTNIILGQSLTSFSPQSISKIGELLLHLISLQNVILTASALSTLLVLVQDSSSTLTSIPPPFLTALLASLLKNSKTYAPKTDVESYVTYTRLIVATTSHLLSKSTQETTAMVKKLLPTVVSVVCQTCDHGDDETVGACASELRKLLITTLGSGSGGGGLGEECVKSCVQSMECLLSFR